ncbi:MAG: oligosaccharide flippase family protein [Lachnospiraceae bacterium]|nr:oligosaccharide flippase family protein [Lachnospiraceae bacterium]
MQTKSRFRLFIDNILVYGLGGVISKIIPFIMLPILVRLYPSSDYLGLNDLVTTLCSFGGAIAICGMYDALFRLYFDNSDDVYHKRICSSALLFTLLLSILVSTVLIVFQKKFSLLFFKSEGYTNLVVVSCITILVSTVGQMLQAPTRINNNRKIFILTNSIAPILSYLLAIPLIIRGEYIMAMPIAALISATVIAIIYFILNHNYFSVKLYNYKLIGDLLKIGLPLLPNFLIYWIYNSADKVMITQYLDVNATGVYSVASRIGHISNLIYTAFSGGWLFFSYSTMKDDDHIRLKSNVFEYLSVISLMGTVMLTMCSKIGFELLFTPEYYSGYLIAPYLFIGPLLLMLYQVAANQFTIIKKTYINTLSLSVGAIINVILNAVLIPNVGIEGAALATVLGYTTTIVFTVYLLIRKSLFLISNRLIGIFAIFIGYIIAWRLMYSENLIISISLGLIVIMCYLFLYRNDAKKLLHKNGETK